MVQTSIEFLVDKMLYIENEYDMKLITKSEYQAKRRDIIDQAKEMEAKQRNHFVELSKWIIENKRSVFINADISDESKRKILNELGYSSGDY